MFVQRYPFPGLSLGIRGVEVDGDITWIEKPGVATADQDGIQFSMQGVVMT